MTNRPQRYVDKPWLADITPALVEGLRGVFRPIRITPESTVADMMFSGGEQKLLTYLQAELDKRDKD